MPNGSYSDGMTTQPARCSDRAQLVVGHEPGEVDDVGDALDVDLGLQLGQVAAASGDHAADAGHPVAQRGDRRGRGPGSPSRTAPGPTRRRAARAVGAFFAGGAHSAGSTPFGTRCTFSSGSSKPSTTSRTMNREQAMTSRAWYVSHHSIALIAAGMPGGTWPPWRPRSVAWIVATSGTVPQRLQRVAGPGDQPVVGVHDVGPPVAEARRRARRAGGSPTPSGRRGRRRAATADRCSARSTRTPSTTSSSGTGSVPARGVQAEHDDLVAAADQRSGQTVDVGGDPADHERRVLPRQHHDTHSHDRSPWWLASAFTYARRRVLLADLDLHLFGEGTPSPAVAAARRGHAAADGRHALRGVGAERSRRRRGRRLERLGAEPLDGAGSTRASGRGRARRAARALATSSWCTAPTAAHVVKADPDGRWPPSARQPTPAWSPARPSTCGATTQWMAGRATRPSVRRCASTRCTSARGATGSTPTPRSAEQLADHVAALGFTHVELLPVAEHPFGGSWGYQVTGYYAPTARYGTPDDFRAFVDIDAPPRHRRHPRLGAGALPEGRVGLARFDGTALYEHADPRQGEHPDWGTLRLQLRPQRGAQLPHRQRAVLDGGVPHRRSAGRRRGQRCCTSTTRREPGEWVPNGTAGARTSTRSRSSASSTTPSLAEQPTAMIIAEESTSWPQRHAPVERRRAGLHAQVEHGLDARHARLPAPTIRCTAGGTTTS